MGCPYDDQKLGLQSRQPTTTQLGGKAARSSDFFINNKAFNALPNEYKGMIERPLTWPT